MSHHNPSIVYLGLDVAKQQLALDPKRSGGLSQVANTAAGHAQILTALRTLSATG